MRELVYTSLGNDGSVPGCSAGLCAPAAVALAATAAAADPPDDPEWHTYYTIRTGIRYTGMPGWEKTLSDTDIWKLTAFLSRMEKLPPAVQEYWKTSFGSSAPGGDEDKGRAAGCDAYVTKPYSPRQLLARIREFLR